MKKRRNWIWIIVLVVIILSLAKTNDTGLNNQKLFFNLINSLDNFPNLSSDDISAILHVNLLENSKEPYYTVKTATGNNIAGFFKSVELRTPKEMTKGGILIMYLKDDLNINEKDILSLYPNATPELKEAITSEPYDYKIVKPWGKVSYQISRDSSKRVVAVFVDSL